MKKGYSALCELEFVGPPEEMEKLEAVNWNMLSMTDSRDNMVCEPLRSMRGGSNQVLIDFLDSRCPTQFDELEE